MIKFKKYLVASIATLMCLSPVFAADTSTDDHITNINYEVAESYKWSAPSDFVFTTNVDAETKTGAVSVMENIIAGGSTLKISIGPDEVFKLTSNEGSTRDYKLLKDSNELSAGSEVLAVPSGVNEATQNLNFELQGVVSGNTSQVAGIYTGTLNFVANIETAGSGNPGESGSSGNTGGSGGSSGSGSSTVSVAKGDVVTMSDLGLTDVDANNDSTTDTFRVLSADGTNVKLLAMDSYKKAYFGSNNTYSGSTLDTEMTNYYTALPDNVKAKIVAQNIVQSVYLPSEPLTSSDRIGENSVGERYVYALDVYDVIEYLGDSYTAQPCVALNQMFFGDSAGESVSRGVWLRSANADGTNYAFGVDGYGGDVNGNKVFDFKYEVRPAFVLNLG